MGFKHKRTVYRLIFEDPELEGLEVDMTGATVDELMAVTNAAKAVNLADLAQLTPENIEEAQGAMALIDELFEAFARHLVSWNLEEEGESGDDVPVPATLSGVKSQDPEFILDLIAAWLENVGGVTGPKGARSSSGAPFPEASLPMEPLSPSHGSSNEQSSSLPVASGSDASRVS